MLLDLDVATLTVWINGERKGVMARPGMTDYGGQPVGRLEGPLRWAVDLEVDHEWGLIPGNESTGEASAAIEGPLPPPA